MYKKFAVMLMLSFCIMYAVMFLNADQVDHIYLSTTRLYMSLLMVAPMAILMLTMMGKMYPNKKLNNLLMVSGVVVFAATLALLRTQTFVGDRQYMKAMIPHHSSAILTSRHADIQDPEVKKLAAQIIESQRREIDEMKKILQRMEE